MTRKRQMSHPFSKQGFPRGRICRAVGELSQSQFLRKAMRQILPEDISSTWRITRWLGIISIDLLNIKSYLTNLIALCDKMMGSLHWGRAMAATHLDFSKAFTWSHSKQTKCQDIWAQRVVISTIKSNCSWWLLHPSRNYTSASGV